MKGQEGERVRKNALGLGLLLGGAVLSYGHSCGCTKAEILAINDDGEWRLHYLAASTGYAEAAFACPLD